MVYGSAQGTVLLGCILSTRGTEIWRLDPTAWTAVSSNPAPDISLYSIGYDPVTRQLIALGFLNPNTWAWDDTGWSALPLRVPSAGGGPMVYNPSLGHLMRYDGEVLWVLLR
jgi:hypothetical protein